jgi:DNA-binding IclR family transcriptional regulator
MSSFVVLKELTVSRMHAKARLRATPTAPPSAKTAAANADANADNGAGGGSALTRLLQILDMFTLEHPTIHVDEVVAVFAVGQSTSYRYLRELSDAGLVASQGKGFYSLGRRIVELERLLQQSDPLLLAGRPVMDSLHRYCENRAFLLCTPYNSRVLCVYKVGVDEITRGRKSMLIQRGRGTSFPLFRGAGSQVILAYMPPHQIKSLYLTNSPEIAESGLGTTWKDFRTALGQIRKQGFAQTVGRVNPGMYSLAVPIMKTDGKVAGSLLLLGATDSLQQGMELVPMMQEKASEIAGSLAATGEGDA